MPEDIRLAKGEELDALEDIVNNHIGSDETHVTAGDKQNWNGKADVAMLETEGYLKKKVVFPRQVTVYVIILSVFCTLRENNSRAVIRTSA